MDETIRTADVRQRLGDLLDRIEDRNDQFVIERRGKPLAAIVPFAKYQQIQKAAEVELIGLLDRHARRLTQLQADDLARKVKARAARSR